MIYLHFKIIDLRDKPIKIKKKITFMNLNDKENLIIISKSVTDPESVVNGNYH